MWRNDGVTEVDLLAVGTIPDGENEDSKLEDGNDDGCLDGTIPVVAESEVNYPLVITQASDSGNNKGKAVILASIITDKEEVNLDFFSDKGRRNGKAWC